MIRDKCVEFYPLLFCANKSVEDTIIKDLLINEQIKAKEVRLLGENGEQLGIVSLEEALNRASDLGVDLVNINPNGTPPVCKMMNYGKYKFIVQKREKDAKKKQKATEIKEMALSVHIEDHDMQYKAKSVQKFLQNGDKVRVFIKLRGRNMSFAHFGIDNMNKFFEMLQDYANLDQAPTQQGSMITMILSSKTATK